jgi:quinol monooxygenase YgiN
MPKKDETQVVVLAHFTARPGKAEQLIAALAELIPHTLAETGCLRYELNQGFENPDRVTFIEKFADQSAFDFHVRTSYIADFFKNIAPDLVESQDVSFYREILPSP